MKTIINMVSGIILLVCANMTLAHGAHHEVNANSLAHFMAHSWPLLIVVALVFFVLWRKYLKTK